MNFGLKSLWNPLLMILFINSLNLAAQDKRPMELEDVLELKTIKEAQISPNGKWVAFVVEENDFEENKVNTDIYLVNPNGPKTTRLTEDPNADYGIQWSPDGDFIAFLSDREEEKPQVFGVSPEGGGAFKITNSPTGVSLFKIAPNSKKIAFVAKPEKTEEQQEMEEEEGRPIIYGEYYPDEWDQLWVAALNGNSAGDPVLWSEEGLFVTNLQWSPNSETIAFSARKDPALRYSGETDIYLIEEPGESRQLTSMLGYEYPVFWSEDHGLIISSSNKKLPTFNRHLWSVNTNTGVPTDLTGGIDEHARFVAIFENFLYVEAAYKSMSRLFKIPVDNGKTTGAPKIISDDLLFYSHFSIDKDDKKVAVVGETATKPADVYQTLTEDFNPQIATELNPGVESMDLGEQKVVQWASEADGELIEGILTLPTGYKKGDRVPLLLVIHGGPTGISRNNFSPVRSVYPIHVFAGKGYAVLQPNYRGSTGYGEYFRGLNHGDISGKDWIDINSGIDAMIKQGIVDGNRLGIMGWSFGGHHTFWGITQTERFKAASAGAGANDLISMYSQTDIPNFYHTYLGPKPWEDFKLYEERSSYRYVNKVTTPLLIQVGENDRRVPAEQSIQFYEALKGIGKAETQLVIYPEQGHRIKDPRLLKDALRRNLDWFEKWISPKSN